MSERALSAALEKMRAAGQSEEARRSFASAYRRLERGEEALLPSGALEPATAVPALEDLPALGDLPGSGGMELLDQVALIKLNGGLATTMGLSRPKSLVQARDGRTFLEIIVGQTLELRRRHRARLPLVLMNSEATSESTRHALAGQPDVREFLQSMVPKLDAETLEPVSWPANPSLEWCPPGHGDVYGALRRSGLLAELLEQGFRYAMISNSDNLGATLDPRIVAYLAAERIPFLMEVVEGTGAERKGGHIARRIEDGQLVLRELAQVPPEDEESFTDYRRWRYYNTNNLWLDLETLALTLERAGGVLELPLIVNRKTVDPRDPDSTPVIQLESAMGAAIGSFPGARVLCVPRLRFAPVKTTDDLLLLRSDVYHLSEELLVEPVSRPPYVELDKRFYRLLDQFERRFPEGPPSLREAERLVVRGDVLFRGGVKVRGAVELDAREPTEIEAGAVLTG